MKSRRTPSGLPGLPVAAARAAIVALALATFVSTASCRGDAAEDPFPGSVELAVTPTPPVVGPALLVVRVRDEEGRPATGATVDVEGTMSHAGMVPVHERAEEAGEGEYRIQTFEFTMGGDWVLRAHITLPDGTSGIHQRELRVVSAPPP